MCRASPPQAPRIGFSPSPAAGLWHLLAASAMSCRERSRSGGGQTRDRPRTPHRLSYPAFETLAAREGPAPQQLSGEVPVIVVAVIGGVVVAGLAWAGWHDFRRRRREGRLSVAEGFTRQREIDRQNISDISRDA